MIMNRRKLLLGAGGAAAAGLVPPHAKTRAGETSPGTKRKILLPDRASYRFDGIHLNAAYTHPISIHAAAATREHVDARMSDRERNWPYENARNDAVALFAQLTNVDPGEVAIVPSTLEGENQLAAALELGPSKGVVTDSLHYDASLVLYGEMARRGMPLTTLSPRNFAIDYDELERAITPEIRLVAVSHVSSWTGFKHDLKRVCEIAHSKNALVYADIIQSVGGIPLDLKESGVDFACAGMYKWLQGEFGAAFLYVRGDRLSELKRTQIGWQGVKSYQSHFMPLDPSGPPEGTWDLGVDTASIFEVSTLNWSGLATTAGALRYILDVGPSEMAKHRDPMLARLRSVLPPAGWLPFTPPDHQGPAIVFGMKDTRARFREALREAKISVSVYPNRIRISPSVHNSMDDIERLLAVLTTRS